MTSFPAEGPNAAQIEYWNDTSGDKWVSLQEALDAQIEPLGALALQRADPRPGESVLDVGCGCGATSLALAGRVGSSGRVLGVDVSAPMLARARERAQQAGVAGLDFALADAQTHPLEAGAFDLVYSRFGVMFFQDPTAAFANLRRALRPGGRACFVCWRTPVDNDWVTVPLGALAGIVPMPDPPPPDAPGPFSFAEADRVRDILDRAGFAAPEIRAHEVEIALGGGGARLDQAADFALSVGPASRALAEAGEAYRERALQAVREALTPYAGDDGVRLGGSVWVVFARNGD